MEKTQTGKENSKVERSVSSQGTGKSGVASSEPLLIREAGEAAVVGWLHARITREVYYFCTVYRYRVWTTLDRAGKEKMEVEAIHLQISRGGEEVDYELNSSHSSECSYTKEVYRRESVSGPVCLTASATLFGSSWEVEVSL